MEDDLQRQLLTLATILELREGLSVAPGSPLSRMRKAIEWLRSVLCPKAIQIDRVMENPTGEIATIIIDALAAWHLTIPPPIALARHINALGIRKFCNDPNELLTKISAESNENVKK